MLERMSSRHLTEWMLFHQIRAEEQDARELARKEKIEFEVALERIRSEREPPEDDEDGPDE